MKKMFLMCAVALSVVSAMARRVSEDTIPKEVAEKIPERRRWTVLSEMRNKARELATTEACEKFGTVMTETGWTNNCEKALLIESGRSEAVCKFDCDGNLIQVGDREDFGEWHWRETRQKEIIEELWKDQSVIDAVVSNVVAKDESAATARKKKAKETRNPSKGKEDLSQKKQDSQPRLECLEELIPLDDALTLAKDGKGKGYFQLALRYASGEGLSDSWRAYEMLRKAADANYANAVLVEGLCDEANLKAEVQRQVVDRSSRRSRNLVAFKDDGSSVRKALREYCGHNVRFDAGRRSQVADLLTNEVVFARVMAKYEKAKALGALTATNQIATLNKRLADFNKALADYNAKEAEKEKEKARQKAENERWQAEREKREAQQKAEQEKRKIEEDKRQAIAEKNDEMVETLLMGKFRVAFKEVFGYEMGEEIAHEAGDDVEEDGNRYRWLRLRKPYRDFQWLRIDCVNDRLWSAGVMFETKDERASEVLAQEACSVKEDLERRYGIAFKRKGNDWAASDYGWEFIVDVEDGLVSVWIENESLKAEVMKEAWKNPKQQKEIVLPANVTVGAWTDNFDAAKMLSKEKNLPILLNFTGSDWCGWCKRMDENVFSKKAWKDWAKKNLVCVTADFPSDRRMVSPSVRSQNRKLCKRFGIDGYPTFVLLSPGGDKEIGRVSGGKHATPQEFISRLQEAKKKAKTEKAARPRRTADLVMSGKAYCVIDLSGGANAESYPVAYLDREPKGGFNAPEYKTTKLVLKRVDAGSFIMGANQTNVARRVTLAKPFYMGLFEVTQKQWELVMESNPSKVKGEKDPVCDVCYDMIRGSHEGSEWPTSNAVDAGSFLGKLRAKTGLDFDLPTEAQWEYTCRAGTTTRFSHGDNEDSAYYANDQRGALEVGTRKPNPWGFYDMHGNVWEWCLDKWETPKAPARDVRLRRASRRDRARGSIPRAPLMESFRASRGGSYDNEAACCTSFFQGYNNPSGSDLDYCHGFRLSLHDDAAKGE